jgi:hypothetical protein
MRIHAAVQGNRSLAFARFPAACYQSAGTQHIGPTA